MNKNLMKVRPVVQGTYTIICWHFPALITLNLGVFAAIHNRIQQLSICHYIFFIPSIAIYLLLFLNSHQAIDNSFWLLRIYTGRNSVDQALHKFSRTKHQWIAMVFELFNCPLLHWLFWRRTIYRCTSYTGRGI